MTAIRFGRRWWWLPTAIAGLFAVLFPAIAFAAAGIHHDLSIELVPGRQLMLASDTASVRTRDDRFIEFTLTHRARNIEVQVEGRLREHEFYNELLRVPLKNGELNRHLRLQITYSGVFDDPVPVRPLNTDNPGFGVSGSITEAGACLLPGSRWYPSIPGMEATYRLQVTAPQGMRAITAGRSLGHRDVDGKTVSTWEVLHPTDGLSLSAAAYIVREKRVGQITAATYFLKDTQHLADSYLEATAYYLELYTDLFGPYPFDKFAVVENFFPTGFGFPSYTLMGGEVLRLPFIVHTSLGHEIAHCWWGNGVYVAYEQGNWCEGLTTYVADYLYQEKKSARAGLQYRRQILRNYATLVSPENDFPLSRFTARYDPATKTIGYDKSAMVFHMLRIRLGEGAFWGALRDIYRQRLFLRTSWQDLQLAFERRSGQSLKSFFDQWVEDSGVPNFRLTGVEKRRVDDSWKITGRIQQTPRYYRFEVTLLLETAGSSEVQSISVSGESTRFEFMTSHAPRRLLADPDVNLMRQLERSEIPATVNSLKRSTSVLIIIANDVPSSGKTVARQLALALGLPQFEIALEDQVTPKRAANHDLILIGMPDQGAFAIETPDALFLRKSSFTLEGRSYDQSGDAFFGVFHHPLSEGRVAALFLTLGQQDAENVARKITHYGKYSYLAFRSARNSAKGVWPTAASPLVIEWPHEK